MRRLIRIELIKIFNYNPFRILIFLYFVFFTLGIFIYPLIDKEIPVISMSDLFRFPDVWPFLTWLTEPYNILLALIIIMITTNEFNHHTFKTQVVFGLSRNQLVSQKIALIIFLALFATLLVGITSVSLGLIYSYKLTLKIALENMWMMALYMLSSMMLMFVGFLLALLIKNTALSILTFLGYRTFIEPILFVILRKSEVRWFLPLRANTKLTPLPNLIEIFQRKMNNSGEEVAESASEILPQSLDMQWNILLVMTYCILIIYFSYRIMQRKRLN